MQDYLKHTILALHKINADSRANAIPYMVIRMFFSTRIVYNKKYKYSYILFVRPKFNQSQRCGIDLRKNPIMSYLVYRPIYV